MSLVSFTNVTKTYTSEHIAIAAMRGITLNIEEGEFVSIMGASGSGKSTLMHVIGLLDRPTEGQYLFNGRDVTALSDQELAHIRNLEMGFVFQAFHLLARTTVLENVMLPLQYSSVPKQEWRGRAEAVLEKVNMTHRLRHLPSQISGGEKQRVAIARALILNPKLILADEPTGNLDSKAGQIVVDLISTLHAQGHTIILVTHELDVAQTAKRMLTVKDGLILSDEKIVPAAPSSQMSV